MGLRRRCHDFPFIEEKIAACECVMVGLLCGERSSCILAAQMASLPSPAPAPVLVQLAPSLGVCCLTVSEPFSRTFPEVFQ